MGCVSYIWNVAAIFVQSYVKYVFSPPDCMVDSSDYLYGIYMHRSLICMLSFWAYMAHMSNNYININTLM